MRHNSGKISRIFDAATGGITVRRPFPWPAVGLALVPFLRLIADDGLPEVVQAHPGSADFRLGADLVGSYRFKVCGRNARQALLVPLLAPVAAPSPQAPD
jgi:hypothetical protein